MNYEHALACLEDLEVHGMVMGLERIIRLLTALGEPHQRFRSIHIAGTNGKGSTAAYIASVLREAGVRAGLYTSPHLNRFTERISISGSEILPGQVARYVEQLLSIIQSSGPDFTPTYFEVTTALAFAYFADEDVDYAVVEAGLGGRLDATNVLVPEMSIITNVALEHTEYLGDSVEEVAREKGGIIKSGVEVVTAETDPRVLGVLEEICLSRESRLIRIGREIEAGSIHMKRPEGFRIFDYRGEEHQWKGLATHLLGAYQVKNAALALGALEGLMRKGLEVPETAIREGLSNARWPGRMEVISLDPYLILDGAHNPHAVHVLLESLKQDLSYRRLIVVIGVLDDKDIQGVVTPLLSCADTMILTRPRYFRGANPEVLAGQIQTSHTDIYVKMGIPDAIDHAVSLHEPGDLILVTGSLYTVGEARDYLLNGMVRDN